MEEYISQNDIKTIENLESEEESSEITQKQLNLQKIIDEFSGTLRKQIKDITDNKKYMFY